MTISSLKGREAALEQHPKGPPVPVPQADQEMKRLEVERAYAADIASAKMAVPSEYRNNPGAVILAQGFANTHGLDILTTIQSVAMVNGRPVINATLQRALVKRAGYKLRITHADKTSATVKIVEPDGEEAGEATYSMEDAQTAGLAGKDNWKKNPEDMLIARATTRAIKRFAPEVLLGVTTEDELEVIEAIAPAEPPAETDSTPESESVDDVEDAEVVQETESSAEDQTSAPQWASSVQALTAALKASGKKKADLLRFTAELATNDDKEPPSTPGEVITTLSAEQLAAVDEWLQTSC